MGKTILDTMKELKNGYVSFFNDGKIRKDGGYATKRINEEANTSYSISLITDVLYGATRSYADDYDFDQIDMTLPLGLIYKSSDVDENNKIKENAQPLKGIVRFYTGSITSYLNGEKTNDLDYGEYARGKQGFINYDLLINEMKENGLTYTGPETFEELKEKILSGENFNVVLSANFKEQEEVKEEPKKLSKKPFYKIG